MRITLHDQGDGWFPEYDGQTLSGTVERTLSTADDDTPYYLVQFDNAIELQETGFDTPSGFGVNRYSHAVIRSRWRDVDIKLSQSVSVFVFLVTEREVLAITAEDVNNLTPRIWASCRVNE